VRFFFFQRCFAEKINCPPVLQDGNKTYRMNVVDVFVGPPEERASLLPDTDEEMVWTLKDSQDYAKAHNRSVFVCQYKGTHKTATVKVPVTAKMLRVVWIPQR
jgi:hypothetical protein